jgi:nucleoside-triphosphatase THEP1
MVIIVTGTTGIGKTSVCQKLIELARNRGYTCGGILTYKAVDKSIIIEDIQTGDKETLAGINNLYHGPRTVKYYFDPKGIDFGIQAIDKGISAAILVVDEIGHLELRAEGFAKVLDLIKAGKVTNCILVIRSELLSTFLPQLPSTPTVFKTTVNSRNQLPQEIASVLFEELR